MDEKEKEELNKVFLSEEEEENHITEEEFMKYANKVYEENKKH